MKEINLKSGKTVTYRRLKSGDEEKLRAFDQSLSEKSRYLFSPHSYSDETLKKVIERSERDTDRVYVVIDDDRFIAYFFLWWFDTQFPVLGIGIADDYQGQGLGGKLMNILIEDAKQEGRDGVELTTALDNKKAKALYEKVGFECLGEVDNEAGDGRIIREYHMLYPITPGAKPPERQHAPPV